MNLCQLQIVTSKGRRPACEGTGAFLFITLSALWLGSDSASAQFFENLHSYNGSRDKISQAAVNVLTNLNLLQVTADNATNIEAIQSQELALQDKQNAVLRDLKVFAIWSSTNAAQAALFGDEVKGRLVAIFGLPTNNAVDLAARHQADSADLELVLPALIVKAQAFEAKFGVRPPAFSFATPLPLAPPDSLVKARNKTNSTNFDSFYDDYRTIYNSIIVSGLGSGSLSNAFNQLTDAMADKTALQMAADKLNTTLTNANAKIAEATKAGQVSTNHTAIQTVSNALDQIDSAIGAVQKLDNPIAKKAALEMYLGAIDEVIAAAVSGSAANNPTVSEPATQRAVLIASRLPALAQAGIKVESALKMPKISSLLMEKELLSVQLDSANDNITFENQRIDALQRKYNAMLLEVQMLQGIGQERTTLRMAATNLTSLDPTTEWAKSCSNQLGMNKPLTNSDNLLALPMSFLLASNAPPKVKTPAIAAVLKFAISIRVARLREDDADLDLIQTDYLSANAANEEAIRMWSSLIATPVNQIASYYSAGFKPAEVADILVKGLGLGAIAWRVH